MISEDAKLDYDDVLIVPGPSPVASRKEVDLLISAEFEGRAHSFHGVPLMAANMDGVGTIAMADALRDHSIFTCLTKFYNPDELVQFFKANRDRADYTALTIGISESDWTGILETASQLATDLAYVCLDVANGYTDRFATCVRRFRDRFPETVLIAGNVVTPDHTAKLINAGADIVKIGIGGGSVCETRLKTGVGYPQFSAVVECAKQAHALNRRIVADGGCTTPGDVAKALAAGADFVMLGGMFAGHSEGGGKIVNRFFQQGLEVTETGEPVIEKKQFVEFYGMSSKTANEKHFGGLKNYRSSEGRTVLLPFRPSLSETILDLLGGLRSACSYVGAKSLAELPNRARFVRCGNTHNRVFESISGSGQFN